MSPGHSSTGAHDRVVEGSWAEPGSASRGTSQGAEHPDRVYPDRVLVVGVHSLLPSGDRSGPEAATFGPKWWSVCAAPTVPSPRPFF